MSIAMNTVEEVNDAMPQRQLSIQDILAPLEVKSKTLKTLELQQRHDQLSPLTTRDDPLEAFSRIVGELPKIVTPLSDNDIKLRAPTILTEAPAELSPTMMTLTPQSNVNCLGVQNPITKSIEPRSSRVIESDVLLAASKFASTIGRRCTKPHCTSMARSRGLCTAHGGGKKCSHPGCTNIAQSRGFCRSHGGGSRCKIPGCPRSAQSRGLCRKHGGGQVCKVENCKHSVVSSGLCRNHGGGRACVVEGCQNVAQSLGRCKTHGGGRVCQRETCENTAVNKSRYCELHTQVKADLTSKNGKMKGLASICMVLAQPVISKKRGRNSTTKKAEKTTPHSKKKKCSYAGCLSNAQSRGLCRAHGGGSRCQIDGCGNSAQSAGLCRSHGGGKSCQVEGCSRNAKSGGLCISHGGGKRCKVPNCMRSVQSRGLCKSHGSRAQSKLELLCGVASGNSLACAS